MLHLRAPSRQGEAVSPDAKLGADKASCDSGIHASSRNERQKRRLIPRASTETVRLAKAVDVPMAVDRSNTPRRCALGSAPLF